MKETEKIIVECASVEQAFVKKLNIRENISKQQQYLSDIRKVYQFVLHILAGYLLNLANNQKLFEQSHLNDLQLLI
jgi:hypothetical protein